MKTFMAVIAAMAILTSCARGAGEPAGTPDAVPPAVDGAAGQPKAGEEATTAENMAHWREELNKAVGRRDYDAVLKALEEIIKLEPQEYRNYSARISVLRMKDDDAGIVATRRAAAEAMSGNANGLNEVAWDLVTEQELARRDPALALKCAEESVRLSGRKEAASLDTLARAWYDLGMLDKAIEIQKESLAAASNADERADVKKALVYYEAVLKAREQAAKEQGGTQP